MSGVEYDRYVGAVIEWCTALEWSAVKAWHGCSSGSIFPGRFVHRGVLDWNGIVMSVLRVCRSGCVWIAVGVCCAVVSVSWIPTTCMGGRLRPCSILGGPRVHELWMDSRIALGLLCDSGL